MESQKQLNRYIERNLEFSFSSLLNISAQPLKSVSLPISNSSAIAIESLLSPDECSQLIQLAVHRGFQSPTSAYPPSYRNNKRLVIDDAMLADALWPRLKDCAPKFLVDDEGVKWELDSINSRFRFCQYNQGEAFFIHQDGVFHKNENEKSFLTILIYLNDAPNFKGGATRFFSSHDDSEKPMLSVTPKTGKALIFNHNIWHDGSEIFDGEKYVLRSDLIYKRVHPSLTPPHSESYVGEHKGYIWDLVVTKEMMVTGGRDKRVLLWNKLGNDNWIPKAELLGHENSVTALCIVENAIWSGSRDCKIKIWKQKDSFEYFLEKDLGHYQSTVLDIIYIPSEKKILSCDACGMVYAWSVSGDLIGSFKAHSNWVWTMADLGNGLLATCCEDGSVKVWEYKSGKLLAHLDLGTDPIWSMASTESSLFVGSRGGSVYEISFQIEKSKVALELKNSLRHIHAKGIRSIWIIHEFEFLSAGEDNKVLLNRLEANGNYSMQVVVEHENFVTSLAVANSVVFSSSYDGKINLTPLKFRGRDEQKKS